jgi:hypothetical protein
VDAHRQRGCAGGADQHEVENLPEGRAVEGVVDGRREGAGDERDDAWQKGRVRLNAKERTQEVNSGALTRHQGTQGTLLCAPA